MNNFCNKEEIIFALYVICPIVLVLIKMDKAHGLFIKKHLLEKASKTSSVERGHIMLHAAYVRSENLLFSGRVTC